MNFHNNLVPKFLAIFLLLFSESLAGFIQNTGSYNSDQNPYRHKLVLDRDGKFVLEWEVDLTKEKITFNITVETRGWIGFGFTRDGKTVGSDVVIGGVHASGWPYLSDRFVKGDNKPVVDDHQDWFLEDAWESPTHTFISFWTPFETCDPQDIPITEDVLTLLWAYGQNDDVEQYHFQNRGTFQAFLLDPDITPRKVVENTVFANVTLPPPPMSSLGQWDVWRVNVTEDVPAQDTTYMCTVHKAPSLPSKHHVVGIRPILGGELEQRHIHHMIIHKCYPPPGRQPREMFQRYVGLPGQECYLIGRPTPNTPTENCIELYYEYSVGGLPLFFPEHTGLALSSVEDEYYLFQIHYDNPQLVSTLRLTFSLEFFYTSKLRPYDLGMLSIGANVAAFGAPPTIAVPPSSLSHTISAYCAEGCTRKMFPHGGIHAVSGKLHTHLAGREARLLIIRNGEELPIIVDDNHNFNYQPHRILAEEKTLLPGDTLVSRCVFANTDTGGNSTVEGFSTKDEMCHGFIYYYPNLGPSITSSLCTSDIRDKEYEEFFRISNTTWIAQTKEELVTAPGDFAGLTIREAATQMDWTISRRRKLQQLHMTSRHESNCASLDVQDNLQSVFEYLPTRNLKEYVKPTKCKQFGSQIFQGLF